jgi:hypothetical protein
MLSLHVLNFNHQIMRTKHLLLATMLLAASANLRAQYASIQTGQCHPCLHLDQVDFLENSTLLHITYTNTLGSDWININENAFLRVKGRGKQYKLINSINLPISSEAESKQMVLDRPDQVHKFTLEFEKIPDSLAFDMIEIEGEEAFNIYDIQIDREKKSEFVDVEQRIEDYPVKERGQYIQDNVLVQYVKHQGLLLSIFLYLNNDYGKYFQVQYDLKNFKGKSILFNPGAITAHSMMAEPKTFSSTSNERKMVDLHILTEAEYSKKIGRRQAWRSFFYHLGEGMAAAGAGHSSSTTTYSGSSRTNANASAMSVGSRGWGYASAYGSSYTTSYGQATTRSYDGAAAYMAQQIAESKTAAYDDALFEVRQRLESGYAKANTLQNQMEYAGYFNIEFKKIDNLWLTFVIDGQKYVFPYVWNEVVKFK